MRRIQPPSTCSRQSGGGCQFRCSFAWRWLHRSGLVMPARNNALPIFHWTIPHFFSQPPFNSRKRPVEVLRMRGSEIEKGVGGTGASRLIPFERRTRAVARAGENDKFESPRSVALERHFTVPEVARRWGMSEKSIRRFFANEPGVLKWGSPETRKKRGYCNLRIPESVLIRVHQRRAG